MLSDATINFKFKDWSDKMNLGKIPNNLLEQLVISRIKQYRSDILVGPGIGKDCGVIDFGEYACVLSTDPITATSSKAGYLGVHISCNDVVTTGAEPIGILVTIMAPPDSAHEDIGEIMKDVETGAKELNIGVLGGHTEFTDTVNQMILSVTAVGKVKKGNLLQPSRVQIGDDIIITKTAGLEGTAIIAHDKSELLQQHYGVQFVERAKSFINRISVAKEGKIAAQFGANAMHDATEGGVLGALWEMGQAMDKGILIYEENIPIAKETMAIAELFDINPLRLISSGTMIIISPNGARLVDELKKSGIDSAVVGKIVDEKGVWLINNGDKTIVAPPATDELYKALK